LKNSNALDVILEPGTLNYKITGGVVDFYFMEGPDPQSVIDQYYQIVGTPVFIPRWSLGFHQCRYGYKSIQEVRNVITNFKNSDIPLEAIWIDIE
jgi:alpha-glucosidase (family GH31 glycosyl hydrolase)